MVKFSSPIALLKQQVPDEIVSFLRSEGLMRQIRDYAIIPQGLKYRPKKAENITLITGLKYSGLKIIQVQNFKLSEPGSWMLTLVWKKNLKKLAK